LKEVYSLAVLDTDFGGLGFKADKNLSPKEEAQVLFLVSAWLESLNSADRSKQPVKLLTTRPEGRRPMTLSEKIFAAHDIERRGELKPEDIVRVDVDWVIASELSWSLSSCFHNSDGSKAHDDVGHEKAIRLSRKARYLSQ
jgi:hypothetical protein